jgi:hypothetical protein
MLRWTVFLISALALGDTLTFKDGRVISGTYLGGTTTAIRFLSADHVETIPISNIQRINFDPGGPSSPSSRAALPANETSALTVPEVANKQQHFCEAIESFRKEKMRVVNEPNPVVRAQTKPPDPFDWEDRIVTLMGTSGRFDTWRGTVRFHVEGQWVILSFFPDCKGLAQAVELSTAPHYRVGADDRTLIPLNSPLARGLRRINGNAQVVASGHLFYVTGQNRASSHPDERQRYRGTADNPAASVASPRYLAAFDRVELAQLRSPLHKHDLVRASEISEYLFCRRSWHLSAQGIRPSLNQIDRMQAGVARHRRHGRLVEFSERLTNAAAYFLIFVLVITAGYWLWSHAP